jgi:hypothetical protein
MTLSITVSTVLSGIGLSVTYFYVMLRIAMLSVIILSVVMLSVIMLNVILLSVVLSLRYDKRQMFHLMSRFLSYSSSLSEMPS